MNSDCADEVVATTYTFQAVTKNKIGPRLLPDEENYARSNFIDLGANEGSINSGVVHDHSCYQPVDDPLADDATTQSNAQYESFSSETVLNRRHPSILCDLLTTSSSTPVDAVRPLLNNLQMPIVMTWSVEWLQCQQCDYKSHRPDFFNIHLKKAHGDDEHHQLVNAVNMTDDGITSSDDEAQPSKRSRPTDSIDSDDNDVMVIRVVPTPPGSYLSYVTLKKKKSRRSVDANLKETELMKWCSRVSLQLKAFNRFKDLVLIDKVNVNYMDAQGLSPLLRLCLHNKSDSLFDCVKLLLKRKELDVDKRHGSATGREDSDQQHNIACHNISGDSALIALCANYQNERLLDVVGLLLDTKRIRVNNRNSKGLNALFVLCYNYRGENLLAIVQLLIDNGARVNSKEIDSGWNCLLALAVKQHDHKDFVNIVRLLVNRGADVNTKDAHESFTFLHILFRDYSGESLIEIVKIILEQKRNDGRGPNLNIFSTASAAKQPKCFRGWKPIQFLWWNKRQSQHFLAI